MLEIFITFVEISEFEGFVLVLGPEERELFRKLGFVLFLFLRSVRKVGTEFGSTSSFNFLSDEFGRGRGKTFILFLKEKEKESRRRRFITKNIFFFSLCKRVRG